MRRLLRAIPDAPRLRYNAFAGSNDRREWGAALLDLARGDLRSAEALRAYESAFARAAGCRHAFSFAAGRMALYALLEALELAPGDEVVLPAFTCAAVPSAMRHRGLVPVYADIDGRSFNLDPARVEARLTPRTRALYLQHTFGVTADADALRGLAARHRLRVIEDASHSLGATAGGRSHGSLGDVALFSTDRTKVVNTHLGGAVTTNDPALAARLAAIQARTPFLPGALVRRIVLSFLAEVAFYDPHVLFAGRPLMSALRHLGLLVYWRDENDESLPARYPYPARLAAPLARIGSAQLEALAENIAHRRRLARFVEDRVGWYGDALGARFGEQAWLRYAFLVRDRAAFEARAAERFDAPAWFQPVLHGARGDLRRFGYEPGSCPVAERVSRHVVNLLTHPRVPLSALERHFSRHGDWICSQVLRPGSA